MYFYRVYCFLSHTILFYLTLLLSALLCSPVRCPILNVTTLLYLVLFCFTILLYSTIVYSPTRWFSTAHACWLWGCSGDGLGDMYVCLDVSFRLAFCFDLNPCGQSRFWVSSQILRNKQSLVFGNARL